MYRIICQSYSSYMNSLKKIDHNCYRYIVMLPLRLITNIELYNNEKLHNSLDYQKVSDFMYYIESNIENHPRLKALLWMLESRGIIGKQFNIVSEIDLNEQVKLFEMFVKLVYWEETA